MNARHRILSAAVALIMCTPAFAQEARTPAAAPNENVTVTGIKDVEAATRKFVETMAVPTRAIDKIARWKEGVCPITAGLAPEFVKFVTQRIKDVAAQVGAPVNGSETCGPNMAVVFTATPQALLDNIRDTKPVLLGFHSNLDQAERLATVTRPIQSWYATATQDVVLNRTVDSGRCRGGKLGGLQLDVAGLGGSLTNTPMPLFLPCANAYAVTSNRLGNGLSSELYRVVIVAEPVRLLDHEIGTLADYIAMLALSQVNSLDSCQDIPTILNILVSGCSHSVKALTSADFAYLRALYKMTPAANFGVQRGQMIYQMSHSLGARQ